MIVRIAVSPRLFSTERPVFHIHQRLTVAVVMIDVQIGISVSRIIPIVARMIRRCFGVLSIVFEKVSVSWFAPRPSV